MRTIVDDIETIKYHILDLRPSYDYVFTSGGIGSTHDDVTYEAISEAFGVGLELNSEVESKIREFLPEDRICAATWRMATLPELSELYFHEDYFCPLAKLENVYVLPGVSRIFEDLLLCNEKMFYDPDYVRITKILGTELPESFISDPLRQIASKVEYEDIEIGSYPIGRRRKEGEANVRIKLTSYEKLRDQVEKCAEEILESIECFEIIEKD